MNLKKLLEQTKQAVSEVGVYAEKEFLRFQRSQIEYKSNANDLVSYVDKETEKRLVSALLKITPKASFIGEENTLPREKTEITWIIDPIDGTTNFVHGIPLFALSVGLLYKEELVLGVVYNPVMKEMFYAISQTPAMLNRKIIHVSPSTRMEESIISIGVSPASMIGARVPDEKNKEWFFKTLPVLMGKVRGVRAIGSAAISLCWVASGRLNAYYAQGLHAWDIAGGALIIQQAGGKITDFKKKDDFLFKQELISAGKVYPNFYKLLRDQKLI